MTDCCRQSLKWILGLSGQVLLNRRRALYADTTRLRTRVSTSYEAMKLVRRSLSAPTAPQQIISKIISSACKYVHAIVINGKHFIICNLFPGLQGWQKGGRLKILRPFMFSCQHSFPQCYIVLIESKSLVNSYPSAISSIQASSRQ